MLLTTVERRLHDRLAVFRGGCKLEAAEEVAEADLDTLLDRLEREHGRPPRRAQASF